MSHTTISRTRVDSSSIASVGYAVEATLEVEFRNGTLYRYFAVPRATFEAFMAAESMGAYFNQHIKGRYPFARV